MNKSGELFEIEEMMQFQVTQKRHVDAAKKVPLLILMTFFAGLAVSVVGYSEYEIIYRIFDYLAGENNNYWSPTLMGFTAATMIIGFHILAMARPHNLAVRIVEQSVEILIPIYLIGIGVLIACILFADGLGSMTQIEIPTIIGSIPEAIDQGWIDSFFIHFTNPLAVLAFSLGIGGLAIVNIFIVHKLLTSIVRNVNEIYEKISNAKAANDDYRIIQDTQKEFSAVNSRLNSLLTMDDNYVQTIITTEVMSVIHAELLPHKKWLQEAQYTSEFRFVDSHRKIDPKQVAKDIAKIEAIRPQDIMNAMNPKLLEKGK